MHASTASGRRLIERLAALLLALAAPAIAVAQAPAAAPGDGVYGLFMRMGGEDLMPRMFHGEPTPEAFGRAVAGLVIDELPGPMVPVERAARETPEEPR